MAKNLEELLSEFEKNFVSYSKIGGFDTSQVTKTAPEIKDFIRHVWSSALVYGASRLDVTEFEYEDEHLKGKECPGCYMWGMDDSRSILLEEAKKV